MSRKTERRGWGLSFGMIGTLILVGVGAVSVTAEPTANALPPERPQIGAQTPPVTRTPEQSFDRVCGRCHPHGGEDIGPAIVNKRLTEAKMTDVIRNGTKKMRPISLTKLTDAELPNVLAHLRVIHALQ